MKLSRLAGLTICIIVLLTLYGCAGASEGVPDQQARGMIEDWLYERGMGKKDYYTYSYTVEHNVDKKTHTDDAVIHLRVEYIYVYEETSLPVRYTYDRTSDLWSVARRGSWSDSVYQYKERELKGDWHIEEFGHIFDIGVKSINGDSADMEYSVSLKASAGLSGDVYCDMSGREKLKLKGLSITIPIKLPENFFCNHGGFDFTENTNISIIIDPMKGLQYALVDGQITYSSPK